LFVDVIFVLFSSVLKRAQRLAMDRTIMPHTVLRPQNLRFWPQILFQVCKGTVFFRKSSFFSEKSALYYIIYGVTAFSFSPFCAFLPFCSGLFGAHFMQNAENPCIFMRFSGPFLPKFANG